MATSSFAVSLTPPMVLKMQEDHTMAASDFTTEETPEFDWGPMVFSHFWNFVGRGWIKQNSR